MNAKKSIVCLCGCGNHNTCVGCFSIVRLRKPFLEWISLGPNLKSFHDKIGR